MNTPARNSRIAARFRRAQDWAALAWLPFLATALPSCSLITDFTTPGVKYDTVATFRNAAGRTFTVTDADATFAGGMAAVKSFGAQVLNADGTCPHTGFCGEDYVRPQWLHYLSRRFAEGSDASGPGFEAFQTAYGAGPYCLVPGSVTVSRTETRIDDLVPLSEADRTPPAECGSTVDTGCGNAIGVVPSLGLTPGGGIDFGPRPIGLSAIRQPIVISNAGPGRLCLAAPRLGPTSANPADFPLDASDCATRSPEEMMLGQTILVPATRPSCTVWVDFRPGDAPTASRSAGVVVTTNDPARSSVTVDLRGVAQPGVLRLPAGPICFNVPAEPIGGMSCHRRTVDLTNDGPGVVTVRSASTAADALNWQVQLPAGVTAPFTIPVGGTVTLTVLECEPLLMDSTFLTINSNSTTPTVNVSLVGPTTGCTP